MFILQYLNFVYVSKATAVLSFLLVTDTHIGHMLLAFKIKIHNKINTLRVELSFFLMVRGISDQNK